MKRRLKQMPVEKPVDYFVLFYAKKQIIWETEKKTFIKKHSLSGPIN